MAATPKRRFLDQKELVKAHLDYVESQPFVAASEAAMLQFVADLPASNDPAAAAASYQQLQGARRFLAIFLAIGNEPLPVTRRQPNDNLRHT